MEKIILDNGNAETSVIYDEQQSSIFWSMQLTNSFHENRDNPVKQEKPVLVKDKETSFDKKLKGLLSVPKPRK